MGKDIEEADFGTPGLLVSSTVGNGRLGCHKLHYVSQPLCNILGFCCLPPGCPLYQDDRQNAGVTGDTTLQHLLFTFKSTSMQQDFILTTKVATGQWLLHGSNEREEDDEWGWRSLGEGTERDREVQA